MSAAITWDYIHDVLGLLRWLHVFAAIIWIGLTAFFWFMESQLKAPLAGGPEPTEGVAGETYYLHGGIFYFRKYTGAPDGPKRLPKNVTWHPQWYAYGTWVTGLALLIIVYFWNAKSYLIDPSIADISPALAITISVVLLGVAWLFYDQLCRRLIDHEYLLISILFVFIVGVAYGLSHLFSPRGVVIETGAVIGTMMAGNVLFIWEPLHRSFYKAKAEGKGDVDEKLRLMGWQRAKHNAYLAPPVIFAMLGSHFSFVTGSKHAWLALIGFMIFGGLLRYFYIWRNRERVILAIPVAATILLVALVVWLAPSTGSSSGSSAATPAATGPQAVSAGKTIFASAGCAACHTLAASGATGTVGPNLDQAKPAAALVVDRVSKGFGAMPAFSGKLTDKQIADVAAYVAAEAGK